MNKALSKEKVYIETSVISYFTGRKTNDVIITARQKITQKWWVTIQNKYENFISSYVIEEISKGNKQFSDKRLDVVKSFSVLSTSSEIEKLAGDYFKKLGLPQKAYFDCNHLACAVISGMDIIVSWNFKHIANPHTRRIIRGIDDANGLVTPEISSPEELMGG